MSALVWSAMASMVSRGQFPGHVLAYGKLRRFDITTRLCWARA